MTFSEDDENLFAGVNHSELVQMARGAGLGNISRFMLTGDELRDLLFNLAEPEDLAHEDPLEPWRRAMEDHIQRYKRRLLSQLPGCDGTCTTYGCPDLIVTRCWNGFKNDMV